MVNPEAKARMRILAVGSSQKTDGFTLLELLVVLSIIAIATAGVTFAMRDNQTSLLEREAERLSVILETARVQSRSSGVALAWVPLPEGFVIVPVSLLRSSSWASSLEAQPINPWLSRQLRVQVLGAGSEPESQLGQPSLLLGAEPMIAPSVVALSIEERSLRIATDGLRPFAVQAADTALPVVQP
jgi:general secretion pathway protein H